MESSGKPVIFFDGICGLCNGFVDFVMRIDRQNQFHFSPLQSDYAKQELPSEFTQNLKSIVLKYEGQTFLKSDAIMKVLELLGGHWKFATAGKVLPLVFRNWVYDLVAHHRYRFFGKKESCRLPTPEERERFKL